MTSDSIRSRRCVAGSASALAIISILLAAPGVAHAQSFDPATRTDAREGRLMKEGAAKSRGEGISPWTVGLGVASALSSNADQAESDGLEAGYVTPSLKVTFANTFSTWTVTAYGRVDADYFSSHSEELDESRLDGRISFTRDLGNGQVGFRYRASASFTSGFGDRNYTVQRATVDYLGSVGERFSYQVAAEQHASDVAELRRTRLGFIGDYTWSTARPDISITLEGALFFSDFQGGANSGRDDLVTQTTLSVDRDLGGVSLGLAASLTHNFSNRQTRDFTAFEVGPTLSVAF